VDPYCARAGVNIDKKLSDVPGSNSCMKGDDIARRLRRLAGQVIKLCRTLPRDDTCRHVAHQLIRAVCSGGSNYEEARGAESRADFIHKVAVATKELRETLYWLGLAQEAELFGVDTEPLIREADELVAILTSSIKTAKLRASQPQPPRYPDRE
jgi:four helix bundle protein